MRDALSGLVDLDAKLAEPLQAQLTRQIKRAILSGRLPCGMKLPSSRVMADGLGISRNTAMSALEQLKAEGYLDTRQGSGTHVAHFEAADVAGKREDKPLPRLFEHRLSSRWERAIKQHHQPTPALPKPFRPGVPDVKAFPYDLWNASLRRTAREVDEASAGYGHISGHPRLRTILAQLLAETRGVVADPSQIIVTASARGATSLIATAILEEGDAVWIEDPGFRGPKTIFAAAGAMLIPVPVDDKGITLSATGALPAPRLIYTTPSHQYPTGVIMHLSRRLELLDLATRANAYVIEDDYDSEFQYRGRPIAALQGLDRARCVLYLGTFSKSLLPSLRLGFLVAPVGLAEELRQVHRNTGQFVPPIIQLAAADFIEKGHYRAHVRRMRSLYAHRLDIFSELIHKRSGGRLKAAMPDGGMQTVVSSLEGHDDAALLRYFGLAGIDGQPLSDFHLEPERASHRGLLMGFSAWPEAEMRRVLDSLAKLRVS